MKMLKPLISLLAIALMSTAGTAMAKQEKLPEVTEDGLHRVKDSKLAIVYAEPGADLAQYQRIKLLDAYVAFKKNWARDQRSRSARPLAVTLPDVPSIISASCPLVMTATGT